MKFLKHFELFAKDMDLKMAHILAAQFHEENSEYSDFIQTIRRMMVIHQSVIDLDKRRSLSLDELNYFAITQDDHFDQEFHETLLQEVDVELEQLNNTLQQLKETNNLENEDGPCQLSIDVTLKSLGVERQAYFGGLETIAIHYSKIHIHIHIHIHTHTLSLGHNVSFMCIDSSNHFRESWKYGFV